MFPIGNQRVGIKRDLPVLDDDDQPTYTEFGEPIVTTQTVWVDAACFEIQSPSEQQNLTVTTSEVAWAFLPVSGDVIPAVDDGGAPAPIACPNGAQAIPSSASLVHNGLDYVMRGDAVLEQDIHGRSDHVFCICEREAG
ncbi:MAG TPA: hypothetical protein PKI77_12585 [Mycobacterium sp.]|nr:hypothetical protein [Mycobacterium sp.]